MKIAVVGAGAIGGFIGTRLALAGEDVTFMVRGANLDAIRANGFKLVMHDGTGQVARNVKAAQAANAPFIPARARPIATPIWLDAGPGRN